VFWTERGEAVSTITLIEIRDALRRTDPAWCALHGQEQISEEEFDELVGRVEDAVEDAQHGTPA
jgi:muramidase (phage lysozyme)